MSSLGLSRQLSAGGGAFFSGGGVLLNHMGYLFNTGINLGNPRSLFIGGDRNIADQGGDLFDAGDNVIQSGGSFISNFGTFLNLVNGAFN